jgi:hypothetical protein
MVREALPLLDDRAHARLDALQVVRAERLRHVEVVVEAVLHRRADAELGLGEQVLHGLRHHVRGGVPQNGPAILAGDVHRLDLVTLGERRRQIPQGAIDAGGDHGARGGLPAGGLQGVAGRRASVHHGLAAGEGDVQLLA